MENDATMLIAGLTSLFAVSLLFLSLFVSGESGGAGGKARGIFKTGNPTLEGKPATQGLQKGHVDVPATLEAARQGVKPTS
jgi:hypothetical protein